MSGILYPILILTLFLIVQILTMMASRKAVLDKNKQQLLDSVNTSNKIYNNEELSILLAEQQSKISELEIKLATSESNYTKLEQKYQMDYSTWVPKLNDLYNFTHDRFLPYLRSTTDYAHSCGIMGNSAGMRTFIQDSWNSYPVGISLRQMSSYGCDYMVIINKTSNSYGTIILTGYEGQYSALMVGSKYDTTWHWSRTNMTNF